MKFQSAGKTHIGRKRKINEDRILLSDNLGLFVIADGIGGHNAGDVASQMVVEILEDYWKKLREGSPPLFIRPFEKGTSHVAKHMINSISLSNAIVYEAKKRPRFDKMGSTVTALLVDGDQLWLANVGDSPAYNFTGGELVQISEEHSLEREQKALGIGSGAGGSSGNRTFRNILTRAIGLEEKIAVFISSLKPATGDVIVLCSDGLTKNTSKKNISAILSDNSLSLSRKTEALVEEANLGGGDDNISVILLEVLKTGKGKTEKLTKIFYPRS